MTLNARIFDYFLPLAFGYVITLLVLDWELV